MKNATLCTFYIGARKQNKKKDCGNRLRFYILSLPVRDAIELHKVGEEHLKPHEFWEYILWRDETKVKVCILLGM